MVQFSLQEWLEDKNREICTRDGRKAVILDIEFETGNGKKSILAKCIYNGVAAVYTYDSNGKANNIGESENDLFFVDNVEEETKIPRNLEEAIKALDCELVEEDKKFLLDNGAFSVHHSLGQWIRNTWGLWKNSELKKFLSEQGLSHPDDMSNFIIEEYITHLKLK